MSVTRGKKNHFYNRTERHSRGACPSEDRGAGIQRQFPPAMLDPRRRGDDLVATAVFVQDRPPAMLDPRRREDDLVTTALFVRNRPPETLDPRLRGDDRTFFTTGC